MNNKSKIAVKSIFFVCLVSLALLVYVVNGFNSTKPEILQLPSSFFAARNLATIEAPHEYNVAFAENYLNLMGNYSDLSYEFLGDTERYDFILKEGNVLDNIKGISLSNKKFAIDLLACAQNTNSCGFRINGVPTKRIYANNDPSQNSFNLDPNYKLRLNSIIFDYCGHVRVCDIDFDAYDIINISIVRRDKK